MDAGQVNVYNPRRMTLAAGTALYLAIAITVFALRRPEYSHLRNTISELGEFGAVDSALVSWGVFFPVGLASATLAALFWAQRRVVRGAWAATALAGCVSVGYIVAAFFPCDPGAPLDGSVRTGIHNMGGAVEYCAGTLSLFLLAYQADRRRWAYLIAAILTFAAMIGISASDLLDVRGLLQRLGEASLFGSLVLATRMIPPSTSSGS